MKKTVTPNDPFPKTIANGTIQGDPKWGMRRAE